MKTSKNDVCYCGKCKHETATDCLDRFLCKCCWTPDKIRLAHPVSEEERELSEVEKVRREDARDDKEKWETQLLGRTWI